MERQHDAAGIWPNVNRSHALQTAQIGCNNWDERWGNCKNWWPGDGSACLGGIKAFELDSGIEEVLPQLAIATESSSPDGSFLNDVQFFLVHSFTAHPGHSAEHVLSRRQIAEKVSRHFYLAYSACLT